MKKKLILNKRAIKELDNSDLDSIIGGIYGVSDPDNTGHTLKQNKCPTPRRFTEGNCLETLGDDTCWTTWLCKISWPGMVRGNSGDGEGGSEGEGYAGEYPYYLLPENGQQIDQENQYNEFIETVPTIMTAKGGGG